MKRHSHPPCAKFAVVVHPGTLFEYIDSYALRLDEAMPIAAMLREDGLPVEIMRPGHAGALLPAEATA